MFSVDSCDSNLSRLDSITKDIVDFMVDREVTASEVIVILLKIFAGILSVIEDKEERVSFFSVTESAINKIKRGAYDG